MYSATNHIVIEGLALDAQGRCQHYRQPEDIVALKMPCCGRWFACFRCHDALCSHQRTIWPATHFDEKAILCGQCGQLLTIQQYLNCNAACPNCHAAFNFGCHLHHHYYFA